MRSSHKKKNPSNFRGTDFSFYEKVVIYLIVFYAFVPLNGTMADEEGTGCFLFSRIVTALSLRICEGFSIAPR